MVLLTFFYLGWSRMALVENIRQKEERANHEEIWKEVSERACVTGLRWEDLVRTSPARSSQSRSCNVFHSQVTYLFQVHFCD